VVWMTKNRRIVLVLVLVLDSFLLDSSTRTKDERDCIPNTSFSSSTIPCESFTPSAEHVSGHWRGSEGIWAGFSGSTARVDHSGPRECPHTCPSRRNRWLETSFRHRRIRGHARAGRSTGLSDRHAATGHNGQQHGHGQPHSRLR